jgi:hypothetical protein
MPRPAHAKLTLDNVKDEASFFQKAYGYFGDIQKLVGGAGPDLAAAIRTVEGAILAALATQRNQLWKANAQTVFDDFYILSIRGQGDPDNAPLWNLAIQLSKTTVNQYAQMVDDVSAGASSDIDSNYQLAPMFNTLVAAHTGLNKMEGEIFPGFPADWTEYNLYLQRAMNVDYELIGSDNYTCSWLGNPGAGNYTNWIFAVFGSAPTTYDAPSRSQLWRKVMNLNYQVGTYNGPISGGGPNRDCHTSIQSIPEYCNPATATCSQIRSGDPSSCGFEGPVWVGSAADVAVAQAGGQITIFDVDNVVQIVKAGMAGIASVGGGNDGTDGASLTLPTMGKLTDPHVFEPKCGSIFSLFRAYPVIDTAPGIQPVAFVDGFQQAGDPTTNYFPNNQVRLDNSPGHPIDLIARTNPMAIPHGTAAQAYTVVLRYDQPHSGSGFVKVGLQNADTNGASLATFNGVEFRPTANNGNIGDWQTVAINFTAGGGWPQHVYARLEFQSGEITYFDAAWIKAR